MRHASLASLLLLAPATTFAAALLRRDLVPGTGLSGGWTYSGCYVDSVASRALSSAFKGDGTGMSAEACTAFCTAGGYPVAGVEYSSECWCGTALPSQLATDSSTCSMPCSGDPMQVCGGPERLSVYSRPASAGPQTNPGPTGWQSLGCYTDSVGARTLSEMRASGDQITVELCAATCAGSRYFGVEYASECFCGDNITNGGVSASDGCNMPCRGDTSELCGGPNRLNLYQAAPSPSPQPSPEPSPSPSPEPTPSPSPEPSPSPLPEPSPTPSPSPSPQPSPEPTPSPSPEPSPSPSPEPSPSPSPEPSPSPSPSPSPQPSPEPSPSPSPTPSPSPSPSPQPVCAPTIQTGGQISNGGFELGSTWTRGTFSNAASSEIFGLAYEGCYSDLFSVTSAGPGSRSVTITSDANITPGTTHTISFYLGRRSRVAANNAVVTMKVNGQSWTQAFQACSGTTCDLVGTGGTMWKKYQAQFTFTSRSKQALNIVTSWSGTTKTDGTDDVLIDGIYIT